MKTPPEVDSKSLQVKDPKLLTGIYKKKGSFDHQRRCLLENFKQSDTHANLLLKLKVLVESKIKSDPTILLKNKGMMAALLQGEIMNIRAGTNAASPSTESNQSTSPSSGLLEIVDRDIQEKIIDSLAFHSLIRKELHEIQREVMGISEPEYQLHLQELERESNHRSHHHSRYQDDVPRQQDEKMRLIYQDERPQTRYQEDQSWLQKRGLGSTQQGERNGGIKSHTYRVSKPVISRSTPLSLVAKDPSPEENPKKFSADRLRY